MRKCIDWKTLKTIQPFSRTHILRLETDPKFHKGDPWPPRVVLGQCRVCWWLDEVIAWLERRPRMQTTDSSIEEE